MPFQLVYEMHSMDGNRVLGIAHFAERLALRHLLERVPIERVGAPFEWQEGWEYVVPLGSHVPAAQAPHAQASR